ncbi:hypothetical protein AAG570_010506 [Ranatra chinensis]|uniref:Carboxylesterase type B domain-containing protein n=1 Tax=Ranatra chinensis TaxID=642074 RepID=A0ABD0ZB27_9HEMI
MASKRRNINPTPSSVSFQWGPMKSDHLQYLDIDRTISMKPGLPYQQRMDIWESIYPTYIKGNELGGVSGHWDTMRVALTVFAFLLGLLCFFCEGDGQGIEDGQDAEHPVVETIHGKVRGSRMKSWTSQHFYAFRGIRFAKPPLGQLRFKVVAPHDMAKTGLLMRKDHPPDLFQLSERFT